MSRAHSLIGRFLLIILLSMLFNLVFSLGLFFFTGTFKRMETESYEDFATKAVGDAESVRRIFDMHAANATFMANNIDARIESMTSRSGAAPQNLQGAMVEAVLDYALTGMTFWLESNRVNGVYFLLCNGEEWERYPGVYLRLAGGANAYEYEIGPPSLADRDGLYASASWRPEIELRWGSEENEFLARLLQEEYSGTVASRADGYWSAPHRVLGREPASISYSVPLLDGEYRVYGVLGIVLDVSSVVENVFPPPGDKFSASYILTAADALTSRPEWIVGGSGVHEGIWSVEPDERRRASFELHTGAVIANFDVRDGGVRKKISSVFKTLDIYPQFSPFYEENWALVCFADRDAVLRSYHSTLFFTVFSIALAVLVAGVLVYAVARRQLRQISLLSSSLAAGSLDGTATLSKTNIAEIDHIAGVLEDMQKNVIESALRVSAIFDLLEMPIGSYEVREGAAQVFVTPSLKKILETDDFGDSMYLDLDRWNEIHASLKESPFEDEENVFRWYPDAEKERMKFLRIEEVDRHDSAIGIITDVTDQLRKNMELEFQANYDSLTRLYNRRLFRKKVIKRIRREPDACGVMLFGDLDGLKQINDVYGHASGDELIKTAAGEMATLQEIGGITSRLSGDEFAAYVHGFESKEEAVRTLTRHMDEHFGRSIRMGECVEKPVSISRGIACYPSDSNDFSNLLTFADYAMYQAKHSNKGSVRIFDRDDYLNDAVLRRKSEALIEVVRDGRISYAFQPMYDLIRERVCGYCVFMRPLVEEFREPKGLIEIAVITEKQEMLEKRIFRDILTMMRREEIDVDTMICVKTIKNYVLDPETLAELKKEFGHYFRNLVVQISADSALDSCITERKVRAYRDVGAGIAFEGFGDSQTDSLEMLTMQPDMVKINVSLIRDAADRPDTRIKLSRIISECEKNGVTIAAFEVESKRDFDLAAKMGFDIVQGYYVGSPEPTLAPPGYRIGDKQTR